MSRLIDFYRGVSTDSEGRWFVEILGWSDEKFEEVHDFIQWLFPLSEPSLANTNAPLLSDGDIAAFGSDPELVANLEKAFSRFLAFLGLKWSGIQIVETVHFPQRVADVWSVPNHNWLRITRVLRCLRILGLSRDARQLFAWLEHEYTRRRFPISSETFHYWSDAINPV